MVHLQRAVDMHLSRFVNWKKFWYFTDNHITLILTIYRECYDIKRNVGIEYVFFQPRALFQTLFVLERYLPNFRPNQSWLLSAARKIRLRSSFIINNLSSTPQISCRKNNDLYLLDCHPLNPSNLQKMSLVSSTCLKILRITFCFTTISMKKWR